MLILAQAWSEAYANVDRNVAVEVSGGGSGQGIAALIKGTIDVANCSRNLRPEEAAAARAGTGKEPREFIVGYDALAVFVHHENPLEEISMEQLAEIYRRDGTITRWSQLGVRLASGRDKIVRVNRQSSSGTYEFFRDHVLGGRDFHLASLDMNGSKEVVELIASTPGAIGYSGMAFATPDVKMLRVSTAPGQLAEAPTVAGVLSHRYPFPEACSFTHLASPARRCGSISIGFSPRKDSESSPILAMFPSIAPERTRPENASKLAPSKRISHRSAHSPMRNQRDDFCVGHFSVRL